MNDSPFKFSCFLKFEGDFNRAINWFVSTLGYRYNEEKSEDGGSYLQCSGGEIYIVRKGKKGIDCGTDKNMFRFIAARRDDTPWQQLYVCIAGRYEEIDSFGNVVKVWNGWDTLVCDDKNIEPKFPFVKCNVEWMPIVLNKKNK